MAGRAGHDLRAAARRTGIVRLPRLRGSRAGPVRHAAAGVSRSIVPALLVTLMLALALLVVPAGPSRAVGETSFQNPLLPNGADPWLQWHNGNYYLATTTWNQQLVMRKSPTLAGLRTAAPVHVWSTTSQGCGSTRSTRAQPFTWNSNGTPNFGAPVSTGTSLAVPSGELGPISAAVEGAAYRLVNRNSGLCATSGGAGADGANVAQAACGSGADWVLDPTADGWYRLVNDSGGKALDAADCATADGTAVRQWAWLDNTCQQWQVQPTSDGWFRVVNRNSGKVLDVADCATTSGADIRLWTWSNSACQQWRLQPVGTLAIVSPQSGKVADVANCATAAGSDVRQWPWLDQPCQKWTFAHTDSGWYQIHPTHSTASCLIVAGAATADGANITQGACSGNNSQWRVEPLADGTLRVLARHSGKPLDLDACGLADGTTLQQWSWLDNICQRFHLRPV